MWIAAALLTVSAIAGDWKNEEIDPKVLTDLTAFTLDKKDWRLGLAKVEYGLLTNTQIGTTHVLYLLRVANAHAKVTAIQTPKLDVSLSAGWFYKDLGSLGLKGVDATITPISWTGSWTPHRRWGIHFGSDYTLASIDGKVNVEDIGNAIEEFTGANITKDLQKAVGKNSGLYGGANLNLISTRFAVDYRINRRDSIIFASKTYVAVSGLLAAGAAVKVQGIDAELGASARLRVPLTETLPSLNSVSWQFSWEHFHLRLGIAVPVRNVYAYLQAVNIYWVLGPKKNKKGAPVVAEDPEDEEAGDTEE